MKHIRFKGMSNVPFDHLSPEGDTELLAGAIYDGASLRPLSAPPASSDADDDAAPELPQRPGFPQLVFGLQSAGYLSMPGAYELPECLAALSASASSPRPAGEEGADAEAACRAVNSALAAAIKRQAHSQGLIFQPMMVRYAWRMADGSLALPSAPVLLLPTVHPPCLAVDSVTEGRTGKRVVKFASDTIKLFGLRCRIAKGCATADAKDARALEIYVSAPVATFIADSAEGVVSYASIISRRSPGSAIGDAFAGRWSEGADIYADRTISYLGLQGARAWSLTPNAALEAEIAATSEFYLAASLPPESVADAGGFFDVPLASTAPEAIRSLPRMEAAASTHNALVPASTVAIGGRVWAAGGHVRLGAPLPPATLSSAAALSGEATAVALSSHSGAQCLVKAMGAMGPIADNFPRYLWHHDPCAHTLAIEQGGVSYEFPLTRCEGGEGAYWFGGLGQIHPADYAKPQRGGEVADMAADPRGVYCAADGSGLSFRLHCRVGKGSVTALRAALAPMSAGQFGQYPIYAFATDGVWALADSGECRQVSADACASAAGIISTERGVAYIGPRGLTHLEGAKSTLLSAPLSGPGPLSLKRYPGLAEATGIDEADTLAEVMKRCALAYDREAAVIWVIDRHGRTDYACSLQSGEWAASLRGHMLPGRLIIITRAIKADPDAPICRIAQATLEGVIDKAVGGMALYASNDLSTWHLAGSTCGRRISTIAGSGWRYYKIAVDAILPEGECIDGTTIAVNS